MLHLYAADRAAPLAARLASVLSEAPGDPMAPEWIATPTDGLRRWLWLELARHLGAGPAGGDGVAANLTPAFPGTLRTRVLAAARAADDPDPWAVERLVWTVLDELQGAAADPLLAGRFGTDITPGYGPARRVADLFDRYHVHRAPMIGQWAQGRDVDPTGTPLAVGQRWQPHLWRRLRARLGVDSPAEALPGLLARLAAGDLAVDLPPRLCLFGLSVLPGGASFVELASAVAVHRDVHLFLLDPSPATSALVRTAALAAPPAGPRRRADDTGTDRVGHPLLRSWARLPRETATLLADAEAHGFPPVTVLADPSEAGPAEPDAAPPATLLAALQRDVRAGHEPTRHPVGGPADRSVQFHATYGEARQVDVARDAILHALADDPTLSEDDILVVCPSLTRFAPLIEAGFGPAAGREPASSAAGGPAGPPALRYRIADRSVARENTVAVGLLALLDVLPGRLDAVTVQELLAQPAIRERYALRDDDLARITEWVDEGNVRWGLDPAHREPFGVPPVITTNSWQSALDRLLLGAAVADDDLAEAVGDVVPIGIEGDDVDLAGRLADLTGRLRALVDTIAVDRTLGDWLALLAETAAALLAPPEDEAYQAEDVRRTLVGIAEDAGGPDRLPTVLLSFADVRRLLRERLAAAPGRPGFFRGGITVTSSNSLRWVPYRVVVLLGMDQSAFPARPGDGDDLSAAVALVGDRDQRADTRQALLEAVLAASDRLVVVRNGRDLRTNQEIPAAVVVAELLDAVHATGEPGPDREVHHPRQSFDDRCFVDGALGRPGAWSFDDAARAGAEARRARRAEPLPFLADPLDGTDQTVFELSELIAAVSDPVRSFLRRRLQVRLPDRDEGQPTALPVNLTGLARWKVGDRLLRAVRQGADSAEWLRAEQGRGTIPSGALGVEAATDLTAAAGVLKEAADRLGIAAAEAGTIAIDVQLPDGTRIVGAVPDSFAAGPRGPAKIGFGSMKAKYQLEVWLQLMALVAMAPEEPWQAAVLNVIRFRTKKPKPPQADVVHLAPGPAEADPAARRDAAHAALAVAVAVARQSRREPIPLFPELSREVHDARTAGVPVKRAKWRNFSGFADGDQPHTTLVYGDLDLEALQALPRTDDDPFDDPLRLDGYARLVWARFQETVVESGLDAVAPEAAS